MDGRAHQIKMKHNDGKVIFLITFFLYRSGHWRCSMEKVFLKILQNSQESNCARVPLLIKLQATFNFIKKDTLALVFSCKFCEISKNTFYYRTPLVTASVKKERKLSEKQLFHHSCFILI